MPLWLKRTLIGLLALVGLLIAAVTVALLLVDTAALKRLVSDQVEANTGRELTIEGELGISLFPWIGFELGSTRLANAEGFGDRPFAGLERAELRVRVLPLLRREVAVDRVVLHGLVLNLARDRDGHGNWEDLVPASGEATGGEPGAATAAAEDAAAPPIELRVEGFELRDARLAWRDAVSGEELLVRDLDLETGPLAPGEPTPVRLSVTLEPAGAPTLALELETEARFDPAVPRLQLADLRVELDARGADLPGGALAATIAATIDADLGSGRVRVDPLRLGALGLLEARGTVTAEAGADPLALNGALEIAAFSPRELLAALEIALPAGLDGQALRSAGGSLAFAVAGDSLRVDELALALDDTRATGSLATQAGAIPSADLRLSLDRIDLDRYLPGSADGAAEPAVAGAGTADGADPVAGLPLESLRGVRADAALDVGRLRVMGLDAANAQLRARLDDGLLVLERLAADVADGSLALGARLDGRTDTPAAGLDLRLAGIQSAPLLQALAGTTPVSGRLDATIGLDTAGDTLDDWLARLGGRLVTTFSDGAVEGINIAQRIRVALAKFEGEQVEVAEQTRRTDFSRLHFAADVREGVVHSDELDLRAPLLRVGGSGRVDLPRRSIDYTARVKVTGTLEGQGGASGERLRGLEIPLRIHGPLAAPKFELAFAEAMKARVEAREEELRRQAREAEEKARRELEEAADKERRKLEAAAAEEKRRLEEKRKSKEQEAKEKLEKKLKGLFD